MNINEIHCPACNKPNTWTQANPHRPFCSARCKLIDLGAWASEDHRIAGKDPDIPNSENNSESSV
jgi:endogenous inhibitor of DNA gyrase (YacG/DUF329 family)